MYLGRNSYIVGFLQLGWHWQCTCVRVGAHYICVFKFSMGGLLKYKNLKRGRGLASRSLPLSPISRSDNDCDHTSGKARSANFNINDHYRLMSMLLSSKTMHLRDAYLASLRRGEVDAGNTNADIWTEFSKVSCVLFCVCSHQIILPGNTTML